MKSSLFAKGRKYFDKKKNSDALSILNPNETTGQHTHRVLAPITQNPRSSPSPIASSLQQLIDGAQQSLLRNYQLTIDQQNETINKQRQLIGKLTSKSKDLVGALATQHARIKQAEEVKNKIKVHATDKLIIRLMLTFLLINVQMTLQAVSTAWKESMSSVEIGAAIKCGLKLTYDQYDGLRNLLSFSFDEVTRRNRVKEVGRSGELGLVSYQLIFCLGFLYPTLPTNRSIRRWVNQTMKKLGLDDSARGAWLSVPSAVEALIEHVGAKPSNGKLHIQVMADAVRVYRKTAFTVVALRALQDTPDYNSMTSMIIL